MISIKDNRLRWAISGVLALLILFGTYRNVFSLAAFLGCCLMIVFFEKESILLQMFFIMPMANIFKSSPESQSFFTILILLYVVLHLVLPRKATTLALFFGIYVVVGELFAGQFDFFRTIKFLCNILLLSSILNSEVKIRHKDIFLSYISGNLIASIFELLDSSFFKIKAYVGVTELYGLDYEEGAVRFKGLHSDPNYYAVGIIVSLCLLLVLYHRKEISVAVTFLLSAPLIYFLIITYSKSALFMIFVILGLLIYSFYCQKKHIHIVVVLSLTVVVAVLALSGRISVFETVLNRISIADKGGELDVNALTTGRLNLWLIYIEYIIKNIDIAIFGGGITAGLVSNHGSHNTYIEAVYYLGIIGAALLLSLLKSILSQGAYCIIKRNILNYSVLICICIMYFFLGELFYYDPPFQIFLAFSVLNLPMNNSVNLQQRLNNIEVITS